MDVDLKTQIRCEYGGRDFLGKIVTDNDSTLRSLLKHKNDTNKGLSPNDANQPIFLADPSHWIKVMSKPLYKMVTNIKAPTKAKTIDVVCI